MFFLLSKLLDFFLQPVLWILLLLALSLFLKRPVWRRNLVLTAFGLLLFFTNPFFINEAWLAWETAPVPVKNVPVYDAAILLTGVTAGEKSPHDRVYFNKGADRLLHTLMLYKEGRFRRIIVSGGSGSISQRYTSEANELRNILLQAGVPDSVILVEDKSRNTRENALFTKQMVMNKTDMRKLLLITSAFHMRRAEACFREAGLQPSVFPADYYSADRQLTPESLIIPNENSLNNWSRLLHEMTGFLVYKILGYC